MRTEFTNYETGEVANFPMSGFIGGWLLVAIVAASMSTGDGAILAMGTVWSHNVLRKMKSMLPQGAGDAQLLKIARISSFFFAAIAAAIASAKPDKTGYFLIVAFVSHMKHTPHLLLPCSIRTSAKKKRQLPRSLADIVAHRMCVRTACSLGGLCLSSPRYTGHRTW
jgi:hypothetical protein